MLKIEIDKQSSKAMARGSTRDIMVETAAAVYAVASGLLRNCPDKCKDEFAVHLTFFYWMRYMPQGRAKAKRGNNPPSGKRGGLPPMSNHAHGIMLERKYHYERHCKESRRNRGNRNPRNSGNQTGNRPR